MKRRVPALVGLTAVTAFGGSLLMAAPASATPKDCMVYLKAQGYIVGPKVTSICANTDLIRPKCETNLISIGVSHAHAHEACQHALWPPN
ncbi:hypothetical protein [Streptomyces acidicola]|uniref:hypothetical protein n=1 Tax=Streptomyces acidicola TaxID=2596892 RepID=UPI00382272C7